LQTFSTAGSRFFSIAGLQNLLAQEFCLYVRSRALRWQNSSIEIGFLFSERREIARRITRSEAKRA
jgi:hypothetical protein